MKELVTMYQYEDKLWKDNIDLVAGIDEVGRGPLAAGVLACAVILDPKKSIDGLNDSKVLSEKKRRELAGIIKEKAISYAYGYASQKEIDQINIYQASKLAMLRAVKSLKQKPEFLLIDAMPLPEADIPFLPIIKGDSLSASIAAASIIAKVKRDEIMQIFSRIYPNYGFDQNKGYPTKVHLEALEKYGPCKLHRTTYGPVKKCFEKQLVLEGFDEI